MHGFELTRDFEDDIADKVQGQTCQVLIPSHVEIIRETLDTGIGN